MNTELMNQTEMKQKSDALTTEFIGLYNKGGDEEACKALLMSAGAAQIIMESFANASIQIAKSQHEAVVRIYEKAILAEIQKESRELDSLDQLIERYNMHIQHLLEGLDTTNTEQVENVRKMIADIQRVLIPQMNATNKPSIFSTLGKIFHR